MQGGFQAGNVEEEVVKVWSRNVIKTTSFFHVNRIKPIVFLYARDLQSQFIGFLSILVYLFFPTFINFLFGPRPYFGVKRWFVLIMVLLYLLFFFWLKVAAFVTAYYVFLLRFPWNLVLFPIKWFCYIVLVGWLHK